jgi:hypothetical protein
MHFIQVRTQCNRLLLHCMQQSDGYVKNRLMDFVQFRMSEVNFNINYVLTNEYDHIDFPIRNLPKQRFQRHMHDIVGDSNNSSYEIFFSCWTGSHFSLCSVRGFDCPVTIKLMLSPEGYPSGLSSKCHPRCSINNLAPPTGDSTDGTSVQFFYYQKTRTTTNIL